MNLAAIELWALRSAAILVVVALLGWRIYAAGERHIQAKWDAHETKVKIETEAQNARNKFVSTMRQNDVLIAEAIAGKAKSDLAAYRRAHPVGVDSTHGMCPEADSDTVRACQGAGDGKAIAACQAARILQQRTALDHKWQRIDELMAEADSENLDYAVCLSTRPKPEDPKKDP